MRCSVRCHEYTTCTATCAHTDAFKKDTHPEKMNLGVGAYRTEVRGSVAAEFLRPHAAPRYMYDAAAAAAAAISTLRLHMLRPCMHAMLFAQARMHMRACLQIAPCSS